MEVKIDKMASTCTVTPIMSYDELANFGTIILANSRF